MNFAGKLQFPDDLFVDSNDYFNDTNTECNNDLRIFIMTGLPGRKFMFKKI